MTENTFKEFNLTDKFINEIYDLFLNDLSDKVIVQTKKCILDYIGVTLAGSKILGSKGKNLLDLLTTPFGDISVIGFNTKSAINSAVLINAMSAHVAELDDGLRQGSIHPGATVISALLGIAEKFKKDPFRVMKGIVAGYEVSARLAEAIQPSHRNLGYHATGSCGTIGVAMGITITNGLDKSIMKSTLSVASTSASGMLKVIKGDSELKPYNAGQAALLGLTFAMVAEAGFQGPDNILDGIWGFLSMNSDKINYSKLFQQHDELLKIEKVYFKPYASCRHCHPAIDATLILKEKYKINFKEVKEIRIQTYNLAATGHEHQEFQSISSAKMSTPFSVAVALITSKAGIDEFSEKMIFNQDVIALAKKVKVVPDDNLNSLVPEKRPAIVEISTIDNNKYVERTDLAKGEPENPISISESREKFLNLAEFAGISVIKATDIINIVDNFETDMHRLFNII